MLTYLLALGGISFTMVAVIPKWLHPKFSAAYNDLIAQLNRKYQTFRSARQAEKKEKLGEFLDVAKKLSFELDIEDCSIFCLIAGSLFVIVSGMILMKMSEQISNLMYLSLLDASMYIFGVVAFFFFSIALYHSLRLGLSLRRL
jgi:hypothetical protein